MAISRCNVHTDPSRMETTEHGDLLFPLACYEDDMETMDVPMHWHEEMEYILVVKGRIGGHVGMEEVTLQEGEGILINNGILHSVKQCHHTSVLHSFVFHPQLIGGASHSFYYQNLITPFYDNDSLPYVKMDGTETWHRELADHMMTAWRAVTDEAAGYQIEARYHISKAMMILSRHLPSTVLPVQNTGMMKRMKQLLQYIDLHYRETINNAVLMQVAACSESVLLRSFHKTVGISPMQYVMKVRMDHARRLLVTTDLKAGQIGKEVGYEDFSYFTKDFHRMTGMTPMEYRKQSI